MSERNHPVSTETTPDSGAESLCVRLEEATARDRDLDDAVAADWSAVDIESWQQLDEVTKTSLGLIAR